MEPNSHLEWKNVIYTPGTLEAYGYRVGQVVATRRVETTGAPYSLTLKANRAVLTAGQRDVAVIDVDVVDDNGRVVPTADSLITFQVEGHGRIIGVGNGNPSSHEADHASQRRAFKGLCQVILQPGDDPGLITLTAASPGLLRKEIVIKSLKG
jgi:beta-galactosidase